jgi:UDP-glucuronate 4-epimerase
MKILLTGAAGFIGMHTALQLLARGDVVVGVDNLNDYYDVNLKQARLAQLTPHDNFRFIQLDIADRATMESLFATEKFQRVINLAAQPGVRYSLKNPHAYIRWPDQHPGRLPSQPGRAPCLRQQLQRIRGQYAHAVFRA